MWAGASPKLRYNSASLLYSALRSDSGAVRASSSYSLAMSRYSLGLRIGQLLRHPGTWRARAVPSQFPRAGDDAIIIVPPCGSARDSGLRWVATTPGTSGPTEGGTAGGSVSRQVFPRAVIARWARDANCTMGQEREPFTSDGYTAPQAPLIAIRFVAHRFRRL